jgi:hypothetical protein
MGSSYTTFVYIPKGIKNQLTVVKLYSMLTLPCPHSQVVVSVQMPKTDTWIKKMWCIYTMEFYSTKKKKKGNFVTYMKMGGTWEQCVKWTKPASYFLSYVELGERDMKVKQGPLRMWEKGRGQEKVIEGAPVRTCHNETHYSVQLIYAIFLNPPYPYSKTSYPKFSSSNPVIF